MRNGPDGEINAHSTPWAVQLRQDLELLARCSDEGCQLMEAVGEKNYSIFRGGLLAEDFIAIDMTVVRAQELSASWGPTAEAVAPQPEADDSEADLPWECEEEGCAERFAT